MISSCGKINAAGNGPASGTGTGTTTATSDPSGTLKDAASAAGFPFGIAVEYALMKNAPAYFAAISREAGGVTFSYQMKHGAIVKYDGSFNYTNTDDLFSICMNAGLQVYGHTLAWHQNQNGNYLRSLTAGGSGTGAINLLPSGDFETGTGTAGTGSALFAGWNNLVGGTSAGSFAAVAGNGSARALEATVVTPGANAYDMQSIGSAWTAVSGNIYKVSVDIKSSVEGGKVRLVMQNSVYQQLDITPTTSWATYTWTITLGENAPMLRFNFPSAGVYTIDNVTIVDVSGAPAPGSTQIATAIDSALSRFIRNTVTRYAGKIKAWDVVNEPMSDGNGDLRTHTGTTTGDIFYWSQWLGRNYALKAFQYAKTADPAALLFVNEYNLEYNNTKLDSLLAYINELKTKGAQIDGIGTQMHININTSAAGIDNAFKKLAATGLKIRVSELDVRVNTADDPNFIAGASTLESQAVMYKYVIDSYTRNVPASQRFGVTVWGVADQDSWIITSQKKVDFPLLFNNSYGKKPAFYSVLMGLKGK